MLLTLKYLPLSAMSRDFGHPKFLVSLTQWWIQGEGPGGPYPLPLSDAFLRLKFLHRQDRISLFNWLIFNETRVAFCYSTKYFCFGYPPMICSPLLAKYAKQYFPAPVVTCVHILRKHVVVSVRSNLPQKKFNSPFWTKVSTPPSPPPPAEIKNSWMRPCNVHTFVCD